MNQGAGSDTDCIADLIPFRCPKCGERRRFATLRELKHHLELDHAFKTACVRPAIFRKSKETSDASGRTREQNFVITSERLFPKHHGANEKEDPDRYLINERMSPLLQSYKDDTAMLELELQMSKQNEMRNKTENFRALQGSAINADFKNILDSLNNEVVKTRNQHWNTADELYKSHDVINGLEEAAENKCKEQRELIRQLLDGMKVKERELKLATKEQNEIKNEQERLCHETEELFRRADSHNETLKRELQHRSGTLESLNHEIETLKSKSSQEIRAKENELKLAEEKIDRLKLERDQLIEETELILKRADANSEELKLAFALKEHKLVDVNEELSTLRNEKHLMLLKTAEFYKRTEEGNDLMRKIIHAKDDQLDQALEHLEKMKEVQQRLVAESATLTDQADDNTSKMRVMLDMKEQEVQQTAHQLQKLKEEKQMLEDHNKREVSSTRDIGKLQDKVKRKEEELKTTKRQLQELKSFLKDAAERERTARAKLEKFIGELITRAERAESELKSLKSQSSSSLAGTDKQNQQGLAQETIKAKHAMALNDRQESAKPVRRKYTPAKPVRRKYKRDQKLAHDIVDLGTDSWQGRVHITPDSNIKIESETDQSSDGKCDRNLPSCAFRENDKIDKKQNIQTILPEIHRQAHVASPPSLARANQDGASARRGKGFLGNQYGNEEADKALRPDQSNVKSLRYLNNRDVIPKQNLKSNLSIPDTIQKNNYQTPSENLQVLKDNFQPQSDFENYPMPEQYMHDNRGYCIGRNNSEEYTYYVPQPPLKDPLRLREPTYGHESTHSLNSIPRVPPHIYNMILTSNKQYCPPRQTVSRHYYRTDRNQPYSNENYLAQDQERLFQDNQSTHVSNSKHRLRPITKVIKPTYMEKALASKEDYNADTRPGRSVLYEGVQTTSSGDWRKSEQIQYEELHDDEIDFPDELFVIPKSASDELTPDLLTPERERHQMKPAMSNDQNMQQKDSLINVLAMGTVSVKRDGNFEQIMDDNGIIWEDMDTLPDVSDSELDQLADRLSPSGSEAIPINKQIYAPVGIIETSDDSSKQHPHDFKNTNNIKGNRAAVQQGDTNTQLGQKMLDDIEKTVQRIDQITDHTDGSERFNLQGLDKDNKVNRKENSNTKQTPVNIKVIEERLMGHQSIEQKNTSSKRFKPIGTTSSDKSNSSEKDLTSGGKEVHNFLSRSPRIIDHSSANCGLDNSETEKKKQIEGDVKNDSHVSDVQKKVSTIFEEKLKIISEKYNVKRHNLEQNNEKDQMQSISDKYRQRRKDIVDSLMSKCTHSNVSSFKSTDFNRSFSLPEHSQTNEQRDTHSLHETTPSLRHSVVINGKSNELIIERDGPTVPVDSNNHAPEIEVKTDGPRIGDEAQNHKLSSVPIDSKHHAPKIKVSNERCNNDEETRIKNEIQMNNVPSDKVVAPFQIENFKEIIESRAADSIVFQNDDLKRTNEDKDIPSVNIESPYDQSVKQNKAETNHGEEQTLDSITENSIANSALRDASSDPMKNETRKMYRQNCEMEDEIPDHLQNVETSNDVNDLHNNKVENENSSTGFSIFAEPIDDSCSIGEDSNTQSMIDRSHYIDTDIDVDTDTESHYKGTATGQGDDTDSITRGVSLEYTPDGQLLKSSRNTMSSASSQASLDFLDHVPTSRREIVRRRRQALCYIFTFLDTDTLFRVAEVCREWKIVSRNPKLWKILELRDKRISVKFLTHLAKRCSQLRQLVLKDLLPRNPRQLETVEEYVASTRCCLEVGLEQILKRSESTLVSLSIINCGHILSSKSLWAASCYSRMLTHVTYRSNVDPINAEVMWALGSGCRDIKTFKVAPIYPCQNPSAFSTKCVQLIGKCFRDLETLSIGGHEVDLSALTFIAQSCQRIMYLELNHMSVLTKSLVKEMTDVGLKSIRDVQLIGTPIESDAVKLLCSNCKYLKSIEIQISAEDFFEGTKQPGNMKRFKSEMEKLKVLAKKPGLGQILKLTIV